MSEATMHKVSGSSQIIEFGYTPDGEILTVVFKSGTYDYEGVPAQMYEDMIRCNADEELSVGSYISRFIKNNFKFTKRAQGESEQ